MISYKFLCYLFVNKLTSQLILMNIKFNGIPFYDQRLVYKAIQSTIAPDAMHVVSRRIAAKSDGQVRQQRISSQRGEVNFIAGWSRSSQHATIRYISSITPIII